ncbi:MAG: sugar phosphate isomerase/epimerase [Clostridia bacterium]|nr:sugar phosphate isomerase/epimerase [Clostridia bacterium]
MSRTKISTEIDTIASVVGMEKAVELVAKAGFDCWDFSLFKMGAYDWKNGKRILRGHALEYRDTALQLAERLRKTGERYGITCNQSHAPFPVYCAEIRELLPLALECTAEAGGKICVVHPDNYKPAEENAEMYRELLPAAHRLNVKIAAENMWTWDDAHNQAGSAACSDGPDFRKHIDLVNDPFLVACVDIGHAEMRGLGTDARTMIRELGNRVAALHIHDNDKWHDSHALPFTMNIDYPPILSALAEAGYSGEFTMETDFVGKYHKDDPEEGVRILCGTARKLADMFDALPHAGRAV